VEQTELPSSIGKDIKEEINQVKDDIDDITGPVRRKL